MLKSNWCVLGSWCQESGRGLRAPERIGGGGGGVFGKMIGRSSLLIALVCGIGLRAAGAETISEGVTQWAYPTPGCSGSISDACFPYCESAQFAACDTEAVCQPTYMKTDLGVPLRFNMTALNPSSFESTPYLLQAGSFPPDHTESCCGFGKYFSFQWISGAPLSFEEPLPPFYPPTWDFGSITVTSPFTNVTMVMFEWSPTEQHLVEVPPPIFNVTFDAQFAFFPEDETKTWTNVTSCRKTLLVRLCSHPSWSSTRTFSNEPLLGGAYRPPLGQNMMYNPNSFCGLAEHQPCLVTPGVDDGEKLLLHMSLSPGEGEMHGVRVGHPIDFTMVSTTLDEDSVLDLRVLTDPGLPIGMTNGQQYPCGERRTCMDVSWTPRKGQEGVVHEAEFMSVSRSSVSPELHPCEDKESRQLVIRFPVLVPNSEWTDGLDEQLTEEVEAVVGSKLSMQVKCMSNYLPLVTVEGDGATGDTVHLVSMDERSPAQPDGFRVGTYEISWTAQRGDEGRVLDWRVRCGDDQMVEEGHIRDVRVRVRLCTYTVQDGDTLSTLARRYHLSTNWLNLWNANPGLISDPDLALVAGTPVKTGPVYKIKKGDSLASIAGQFATTAKKLLSVNPLLSAEVPPNAELEPGAAPSFIRTACPLIYPHCLHEYPGSAPGSLASHLRLRTTSCNEDFSEPRFNVQGCPCASWRARRSRQLRCPTSGRIRCTGSGIGLP